MDNALGPVKEALGKCQLIPVKYIQMFRASDAASPARTHPF